MKQDSKQKLIAFFSLFFVAFIFAGCIAAVPVIVHYESTNDGFVATADVDKSADEIWQSATQLADKRVAEGRLKIVKKDDSDRLLKITDDVQKAEIKVEPKEDGGSKIIIKADVPDEKDEKVEDKKEEELALRIMSGLCEEAKTDCKLEEK